MYCPRGRTADLDYWSRSQMSLAPVRMWGVLGFGLLRVLRVCPAGMRQAQVGVMAMMLAVQVMVAGGVGSWSWMQVGSGMGTSGG